MAINKRALSLGELTEFGSLVKAGLKDLEQNVFSQYVLCSRCKDAVAALPIRGHCVECEKTDDEVAGIKRHLESILSPFALNRFTLENYRTTTQAQENVKEVAIKYRPDKQNLFLWGPCGTGKSHIAIAILQEWAVAMRGSVGYERMTELMRFIRGMRGAEEVDFIESLAARRLLVIDDLGVGRGTEFMLSVVYEIIEARSHRGRAGLIITSNLSPESLSEKFGDDRLSSRISGLFTVHRMEMEDWRIKSLSKNLGEP